MTIGDLIKRLEELREVLGADGEVRLLTLSSCPVDVDAAYIVERPCNPGLIWAVPGREGAAMLREVARSAPQNIIGLYRGYWAICDTLEKAKANRTKIRKRVAAGAGHETQVAHADGLVDGLESALELLRTGGGS